MSFNVTSSQGTLSAFKIVNTKAFLKHIKDRIFKYTN